MDMAGEDASIEPKNMSSQWQLNRNNITNTSMVINPTSNLNDESSACSSNTMADSICPPIWNQPINGQSLGYRDMIVERNTNTSNTLGDGTSSIVPVRPNAILRGSTFLPDFPVMLPSSLPHLPADSGFIERAARFSCFGGGNFVDMMSPFRISESLNPYTRDLASQGPLEVLKGNGSKSLPVMQTQIHEMNAIECSKEVSLPVEQGTEGSPIKNDKMIEQFPSSHDEANLGIGVSAHEFAEAEFSGSGFQGELEDEAGESSAKELGSKKRKRTGQVNNGCRQPANEPAKDHAEIQQQGDQNPASSKPCGKHDRPGSQGSDLPKEEYVHVRARKGQATNSHSLAERVRREKISERMKFLQDLVPGCSKVTGKAVMLDEIINYVQSLQRQVEFLSMKLVTVNSRLDFNIEGLLAKEPRAGPPSSSAFSSYMTMPYPPLHQSQTGIIQAVLPGLGSSSGPLQGSVNPQLTTVGGRYKEKESTSQVHCAWEDEFRNIIQMGFTSNDHLNSQNFSGHMKTDL